MTIGKKVELCSKGLIIYHEEDKIELPWTDLVGVGKFRGYVYTRGGKKFSLEFLRFVKIYDYGDNKIGEGEPVIYTRWDSAFYVIKQYIIKYGHKYIEEFEGLYFSWYAIHPKYWGCRLRLSRDEKKDRNLFFSIIGSLFVFLVMALLIQELYFNGQSISGGFWAFFIIAIFFILFFSSLIFMIFCKRRSKIINLLKTHGEWSDDK